MAVTYLGIFQLILELPPVNAICGLHWEVAVFLLGCIAHAILSGRCSILTNKWRGEVVRWSCRAELGMKASSSTKENSCDDATRAVDKADRPMQHTPGDCESVDAICKDPPVTTIDNLHNFIFAFECEPTLPGNGNVEYNKLKTWTSTEPSSSEYADNESTDVSCFAADCESTNDCASSRGTLEDRLDQDKEPQEASWPLRGTLSQQLTLDRSAIQFGASSKVSWRFADKSGSVARDLQLHNLDVAAPASKKLVEKRLRQQKLAEKCGLSHLLLHQLRPTPSDPSGSEPVR